MSRLYATEPRCFFTQISLSDHADGFSHGEVDRTYASNRSANSLYDSIAPGTGSIRAKIPGTSSNRPLYSSTTRSCKREIADEKFAKTLSISTYKTFFTFGAPWKPNRGCQGRRRNAATVAWNNFLVPELFSPNPRIVAMLWFQRARNDSDAARPLVINSGGDVRQILHRL